MGHTLKVAFKNKYIHRSKDIEKKQLPLMRKFPLCNLNYLGMNRTGAKSTWEKYRGIRRKQKEWKAVRLLTHHTQTGGPMSIPK